MRLAVVHRCNQGLRNCTLSGGVQYAGNAAHGASPAGAAQTAGCRSAGHSGPPAASKRLHHGPTGWRVRCLRRRHQNRCRQHVCTRRACDQAVDLRARRQSGALATLPVPLPDIAHQSALADGHRVRLTGRHSVAPVRHHASSATAPRSCLPIVAAQPPALAQSARALPRSRYESVQCAHPRRRCRACRSNT